MLVHKFGGTSVADAQRMLAVADLVSSHPRPAVVVTSAMAGVTDELIRLGRLARERAGTLHDGFVALRGRHLEAAERVATAAAQRDVLTRLLDGLLREVEQLLHGVHLLQELSPRSLDLVMSFGERLAAPLLAAALNARGTASEAVDARDLLRTDGSFGRANVDLTASRALSRERLLPLSERLVPVVTGFIGGSADGETTTLGRGGSDYSGALFGAFLSAQEIWIWTDVDGVMTADPRVVPEARVLDLISYREAAEMAYFGSKVLHPSTMIPAVQAGIPIRTRNTFNPEHTGTLIAAETHGQATGVKTVTSIPGMALLTVEGKGMIGVPGVVGRLFSTTARLGINVYMISQASSEQNISFLVRAADGEAVRTAVAGEFESEIERGKIDRIDVLAPVGILAIIGEEMRGTPGISQKLFTALGRVRINVLAIAQGSSELNVSVVVEERELPRAVGAVHTAFGLTRDTHVVLLGKGLIGRALLGQLVAARTRLAEEHGLTLKVVGVCSRTSWLHEPHGLPLASLERIAAGASLEELGATARPGDEELLQRIVESQRLDVVLVDVTADELGELHRCALARGLHVVTANKKPLSGSLELYRAIRKAARQSGSAYHFETTFGAGLPVLFTLQDLLATHDRILRITGCFSGTLGYLCSRLQQGAAFSQAVREAKARGLTEPDPRDDLSGLDVARKALIIAREIGMPIEMSEVALEPFVPASVAPGTSVEQYLDALQSLDTSFSTRVAELAARGEVLRYLAEVSPRGVRVGLEAVPKGSAAGSLDGPDNILIYETERYREQPLVIRGPGAGAEVTAAGVFGDILKVARRG